MLRALLLLLVLANAGFFAWTRGWLDDAVGVRASGDREPGRLALQVRPESVRVLPPSGAGSAVLAPAPVSQSAPACLEAGPFDDAGMLAAETALRAAAPASRWTDVASVRPGIWLVYMGRYANSAGLATSEAALKRRNIGYELIDTPAELGPGLALGRYDDRSLAEQALVEFNRRGVRSARIVELAPAARLHLLRVDGADADLAQQLVALRDAALGNGFVRCPAAAAVEAGR